MKQVVYKPNSDISKGSAFQFGESHNKRGVPSMFVEATVQSREKPRPGSKESPFNWNDKLTLKAEIAEVGSMLATLDGKQPETKLYHKYEKDDILVRTSEFRLAPGSQEGSFSISLKATQGESVTNVRTFLTASEAAILRELCKLIIKDYFEFRMPSKSRQEHLTSEDHGYLISNGGNG